MTNIDFQNGFVCGMATKGLVRSGELYKPTCWNDSGVYTYFYIDFKRGLNPFSLGMFNESIIVYDSEQIPVSQVEHEAWGRYKVYCNFSDKIRGITVINKKNTLLTTTSGIMLPAFSTMFYVSGLDTYIRKVYQFNTLAVNMPTIGLSETSDVDYYQLIERVDEVETLVITALNVTMAESIDVSYWSV